MLQFTSAPFYTQLQIKVLGYENAQKKLDTFELIFSFVLKLLGHKMQWRMIADGTLLLF